jgi:hypothetical protein
VSEKVVISYQGARFRLGRSQTFFAIWPDGMPLDQPLEQWPATPEGWSAAWVRFNELETPGTIVQAQAPAAASVWGGRPSAPTLTGFKVTNSSALLVIGVVFGVVGLFPGYWGSSSLASQTDQLVAHLLYLLAWAIAAVGVLAGGNKARIGALLGLGTSVATLGLFVSDIGQLNGASVGAGLVLALIGWVACTAGVVLALRGSWKWRELLVERLSARSIAGTAVLGAVAVGVAVTYALSWDTLTIASSQGQLQTSAYGNIVSESGVEVFGTVLVMIAIIAVATLAGLWRNITAGAALLAGVLFAVVAQAISAPIQAHDQTSVFAAGAKSAGDVFISYGLTPSFWLYCLFAVALVVSCAWMLVSPAGSAVTVGVPVVSPAPPADAALDEDDELTPSGSRFLDPDNNDTDILASGDDAPAL